MSNGREGTVDVVCDCPAHPPRVVRLVQWYAPEGDTGITALTMKGWNLVDDQPAGARLGTVMVRRTPDPDALRHPGRRARWVFDCWECGDSVIVSRNGRVFWPALADYIEASDTPTITLRTMRRLHDLAATI